MTNDWMLGGVYIMLALAIVVSALLTRREPVARLAKMALAWVAIFGAGFVIFTFRDDLGMVGDRLRSEVTGEPITAAGEIRVPMAIDGHFWVEVEVNGMPVNFLVDSGATMTTLARPTAEAAGVAINPRRDQMVRTGNGVVRVSRGRADSLSLGPIERRDMAVHVTDQVDLNVIGMNFLSTLDRWGVEGRWLVLEP
ncbi:retropepsin-like aspartic protease family protein [Sphingomicrobium astaxanthinifaciens]|uniref:retropepsin-like aspartic protease family protein n=1 Tax=Sphingomicrobium astaxanthinifaciens TaxID=1227949 RepID=UPI001FCC8759|nr:TIGR02281 family clan AA aspartic protease [Sphingomicrobium astaxanthinifaciens]MCJ7422397.1 TIGR02281 family clan AA aspartic protease [Sphingomicrobium astaxanthinifaciens]